jgi:hypothetical protein
MKNLHIIIILSIAVLCASFCKAQIDYNFMLTDAFQKKDIVTMDKAIHSGANINLGQFEKPAFRRPFY